MVSYCDVTEVYQARSRSKTYRVRSPIFSLNFQVAQVSRTAFDMTSAVQSYHDVDSSHESHCLFMNWGLPTEGSCLCDPLVSAHLKI